MKIVKFFRIFIFLAILIISRFFTLLYLIFTVILSNCLGRSANYYALAALLINRGYNLHIILYEKYRIKVLHKITAFSVKYSMGCRDILMA